MKRGYKWFVTFVAFASFFAFGKILPDEPLKSKAMVVGIGIDLAEEEKLTLHLQILTGKGASSETGSNTRVMTATAPSIGEAAYNISRETGLIVTLTHCNVVVLGESLFKSKNVYSALNYLATNAYLSDNACIFTCAGSAKDVLSAKVAFGGNTSLYIREIVGQYDSFGDIAARTIREYIVDYHRKGQTNCLPYIVRKETDGQIPSSSSDSEMGERKDALFDLTGTAVIVKNEWKKTYREGAALVLNCLLGKIDKGQWTGSGDRGEIIDWYILKNDVKKEYSLSDKTVRLTIKLKVVLKEIVDYSENDGNIDRSAVTEREKKRAEEDFARLTEKIFYDMQECGADGFGLTEGFFSRYPNRTEDIAIGDINLRADVEFIPA